MYELKLSSEAMPGLLVIQIQIQAMCPVSPEGLLWKNLNFEFKSIFFSKNLASPERPEKKYYGGAYELIPYTLVP